MDRDVTPSYFPKCPRSIALVDQYLWPEKDTTAYKCYNGISHPIYGCDGKVNFSLPLEKYPVQGHVHEQIAQVKRPHLNYRQDPRVTYLLPPMQYRKDLIQHYNSPMFYTPDRAPYTGEYN